MITKNKWAKPARCPKCKMQTKLLYKRSQYGYGEGLYYERHQGKDNKICSESGQSQKV